MNVAFITPEYPITTFKGNVGGIGTFTKNLAEQLVTANCNITVFIHSQSIEKVIKENRVEIHFVKKKVTKGFTWYSNRSYFNKYVNKIIDQKKISVIEAPEWTGFTAFMKFKCPLVVRLHGSDTYFCNLENRKVKKKNYFFERKALKSANKIIGVSGFVAEKTKELFKIKKSIEVIHNTIDTSLFTPNHRDIKPKTLLYFGTIIRKKGVLEIAKTFNNVIEQDEEVELTILGRDTDDVFTNQSTLVMFKELLSDQALKKVNFLKAVPYEEVINHLQKAEIILLPSFAEAFPMTWLEAMALEKKLITSNIGWAKELMIDGETGYTVNPTNTQNFSTKVINLLNQKETSLLMAKTARKRIINNFDAKQSIVKNIAMYKSII